MRHDVIDIEGKKTKDVELSDKIFSLKPNNTVIQSILEYQINNFKSRTAKTKQRNEITGSTSKIYAQKGTGGARHSSRKAPIFVGGGIAHGPKGKGYRLKKINKKVKVIGLKQLLSQKKNVNSLYIMEDFTKEIKKTKIFYDFLEKNKLRNSLFISDKVSKDNIIKSARNIPNIKVINQDKANVYDILKFKNLIFTISSFKYLQERLMKWKNLLH